VHVSDREREIETGGRKEKMFPSFLETLTWSVVRARRPWMRASPLISYSVMVPAPVFFTLSSVRTVARWFVRSTWRVASTFTSDAEAHAASMHTATASRNIIMTLIGR